MGKKVKINFMYLGIIMIVSILLYGCACEHEYDQGTVVREATCTTEGLKSYVCSLCGEEKQENIPCIPHEYEEKVTKEPTFADTGVLTYTCKLCGNTYTEEIPVKEKNVIVTVTDKTNVPKDIYNGRYSDRVEFTFSINNQTDEEIKGIEGVLNIQDMFGKDILSMNCDFTGQTIPAGSAITVSGLGMDINQFMDNHMELYSENFSDLKFNYEISDIIGSNSQTSDPVQSENAPVSVNVVNKQNVPKDIYSGRYSDRVQFTIEVTNNTQKSIKGISGVMTVKDLFGKEITSRNCDFTGQTISPGDVCTYSGLGMDINQFIDSDVKLYNEKFDDLKFDYDVNSVVYSDGTTESF